MTETKQRMTLDDVLSDMRSRGMSMTKGILGDLIENGQIPIGSVHRNTKANGKPSNRRVFLIFRTGERITIRQKNTLRLSLLTEPRLSKKTVRKR